MLKTIKRTIQWQDSEARRHRTQIRLKILELLGIWCFVVNVCRRGRHEMSHQRRTVDIHLELADVDVVVGCDDAAWRHLLVNTGVLFVVRQVKLGRRIAPQLPLKLAQQLVALQLKDVLGIGTFTSIAQVNKRVPQERILFE